MRRGLLPRLLLAVAVLDLVFLALPTLVVLAASFTAGNIVTFPPQGFSLRWYANLLRQARLPRGPVALAAGGPGLHRSSPSRPARWPPWRWPASGCASPPACRSTCCCRSPCPLVVSGIGLMLVFGPLGLAGLGLARGPRLLRHQPAVHDLGGGRGREPSRPRPRARRLELRRPADPRLLHRHPAGAWRPGIVTGALVMFILAVNEFLVSLMLVDARTVTLPVLVYNAIRSIITPDLAAVSVVYVVLAAAAIWLLDRLVGLDLFLKAKQN